MKPKKKRIKPDALLQMFKKRVSPIEHKRKLYYKIFDSFYVDNRTGEYLYYSGTIWLVRTGLKRGSGQSTKSLLRWKEKAGV